MTLSDATLRIERSGPDEMHWTIVDLPGLIRKDTHKRKPTAKEQGLNRINGQSEDETGMNAAVAWELARSYLANDRNIILQVPLPLLTSYVADRGIGLSWIMWTWNATASLN